MISSDRSIKFQTNCVCSIFKVKALEIRSNPSSKHSGYNDNKNDLIMSDSLSSLISVGTQFKNIKTNHRLNDQRTKR